MHLKTGRQIGQKMHMSRLVEMSPSEDERHYCWRCCSAIRQDEHDTALGSMAMLPQWGAGSSKNSSSMPRSIGKIIYLSSLCTSKVVNMLVLKDY